MSSKSLPMITKSGRELADNLSGAIGYTSNIARTCSLIARHAKTLHKLYEIECNGAFDWQPYGATLSDEQAEWVSHRIERLQARIDSLVRDLPDTDDGPFILKFNPDPRGAAVKLNAPGESSHTLTGKDWGGDVAV